MEATSPKYSNVDEYIATFPEQVQIKLKDLRKFIKENAPDAVEGISYGLAGYKLNNKPLVYFGGFKTHIGFFPTGNGVAQFTEDLKGYKTSKGTIQFPLDVELPYPLIKRIIEYRKGECQK